MPKFTKGEWVVSTCSHRVSVWSENESIIESMTFRYPNTEDEQRVMANAHLIAAAPDMYNALLAMSKGEGLQPGTTIEKILLKARGESTDENT